MSTFCRHWATRSQTPKEVGEWQLVEKKKKKKKKKMPSTAQYLTDANSDTGPITMADSWLPRLDQYCAVLSPSAIRTWVAVVYRQVSQLTTFWVYLYTYMLRCGHSGHYSILALSVEKIWNILTTIREHPPPREMPDLSIRPWIWAQWVHSMETRYKETNLLWPYFTKHEMKICQVLS